LNFAAECAVRWLAVIFINYVLMIMVRYYFVMTFLLWSHVQNWQAGSCWQRKPQSSQLGTLSSLVMSSLPIAKPYRGQSSLAASTEYSRNTRMQRHCMFLKYKTFLTVFYLLSTFSGGHKFVSLFSVSKWSFRIRSLQMTTFSNLLRSMKQEWPGVIKYEEQCNPYILAYFIKERTM
jgi:hypothetical protein